MKSIKDLFGSSSLSGEEFGALLQREGLVLLEDLEGGYIPAGRERELQERFGTERASFEKTLAEHRARAALQLELVKRGAHNPTLAAAALGIEGMSGDEATLMEAASRRVTSLMESEPYMFRSVEPSPTVSTGTRHGRGAVDVDSMSDADYYRYMSAQGN